MKKMFFGMLGFLTICTLASCKEKTYTVTYNTYCDRTIDSQTVKAGTVIKRLPTLSKEDYTFKGWDYDKQTPINSDLEINALWDYNYINLGFINDNSFYAKEALAGVNQAIDEINSKGGTLGKSFRLIVEDSKTGIEGAFNNILKQDEPIVAFFGYNLNSSSSTLSRLCESKQIPLFDQASLSSYTNGKTYTYSLSQNEDRIGFALARMCQIKLYSNIYLLTDSSDDYSKNISAKYKEQCEEFGIKINSEISYQSSSDIDFSEIISQIPGSADAIIMTDNGTNSLKLIKEIRALETSLKNVNILLTNTIDTTDADVDLNNVLFVSNVNFDLNNKTIKSFVDKFKLSNEGKMPTEYAAMSYDMVYMFKEALVLANKIDSKEINLKISTLNFSGITAQARSFNLHRLENNVYVLKYDSELNTKLVSKF